MLLKYGKLKFRPENLSKRRFTQLYHIDQPEIFIVKSRKINLLGLSAGAVQNDIGGYLNPRTNYNSK